MKSAMEKRADTLKAEARRQAEENGHTLGKFKKRLDARLQASCSTCGSLVFVDLVSAIATGKPITALCAALSKPMPH